LILFVVLHVKPHAEKSSLKTADQCEKKRQRIHIRYVANRKPDVKQPNGQWDADDQQKKGKAVEKDEGMEVTYDIFKEKAFPKAFEEQP
jgi:hypothetical protein